MYYLIFKKIFSMFGSNISAIEYVKKSLFSIVYEIMFFFFSFFVYNPIINQFAKLYDLVTSVIIDEVLTTKIIMLKTYNLNASFIARYIMIAISNGFNYNDIIVPIRRTLSNYIRVKVLNNNNGKFNLKKQFLDNDNKLFNPRLSDILYYYIVNCNFFYLFCCFFYFKKSHLKVLFYSSIKEGFFERYKKVLLAENVSKVRRERKKILSFEEKLIKNEKRRNRYYINKNKVEIYSYIIMCIIIYKKKRNMKKKFLNFKELLEDEKA
jgi:hypothetical protein